MYKISKYIFPRIKQWFIREQRILQRFGSCATLPKTRPHDRKSCLILFQKLTILDSKQNSFDPGFIPSLCKRKEKSEIIRYQVVVKALL